ncbi:MAG: alpha/beta hydrolase [Bacteroidota bacterium]
MNYAQFRNRQQTFVSKDGELKYLDEGFGEVLLLLHGVPTSGWLYRHMIDDLSKSYRLIVPDMLGFGSSTSPKGYEIYSEEYHAKRLLALMDHLGVEQWSHVMHDAGGLWTWELLRMQPLRVQRLVVLNTIIYEEGFRPPIPFQKGLIARLVMWSYRNGITTNMMLKGLFKAGLTTNNLDAEALEGYKTPLLEGKTRAMYYFFSQTCHALPNYSEVIKKITVPTIVIWGRNDSFLKWDPQEEKVKQDLGVDPSAITLLKARHFIQEEEPLLIAQQIDQFLSK